MPFGTFKNKINSWDYISDLNEDWVNYECKYCGNNFKKLRNDRKVICRYCKGEYNAHKKNDVFKILKHRVFGNIKECQICFKKKKDLVLHHKDGNPENNNVKNLVLCCRSCHSKIHKGIRGKVGDKYTKEFFSFFPERETLNKIVKNSFYKSKKKEIKYEKTFETRTSVLERTNTLIKNKGEVKNQITKLSDRISY